MKRRRISWPPRRARQLRLAASEPVGEASPRNPVIGLFGRMRDGTPPNAPDSGPATAEPPRTRAAAIA